MKYDKSGLRGFTKKYKIEGIPKITPNDYLEKITS